MDPLFKKPFPVPSSKYSSTLGQKRRGNESYVPSSAGSIAESAFQYAPSMQSSSNNDEKFVKEFEKRLKYFIFHMDDYMARSYSANRISYINVKNYLQIGYHNIHEFEERMRTDPSASSSASVVTHNNYRSSHATELFDPVRSNNYGTSAYSGRGSVATFSQTAASSVVGNTPSIRSSVLDSRRLGTIDEEARNKNIQLQRYLADSHRSVGLRTMDGVSNQNQTTADGNANKKQKKNSTVQKTTKNNKHADSPCAQKGANNNRHSNALPVPTIMNNDLVNALSSQTRMNNIVGKTSHAQTTMINETANSQTRANNKVKKTPRAQKTSNNEFSSTPLTLANTNNKAGKTPRAQKPSHKEFANLTTAQTMKIKYKGHRNAANVQTTIVNDEFANSPTGQTRINNKVAKTPRAQTATNDEFANSPTAQTINIRNKGRANERSTERSVPNERTLTPSSQHLENNDRTIRNSENELENGNQCREDEMVRTEPEGADHTDHAEPADTSSEFSDSSPEEAGPSIRGSLVPTKNKQKYESAQKGKFKKMMSARKQTKKAATTKPKKKTSGSTTSSSKVTSTVHDVTSNFGRPIRKPERYADLSMTSSYSIIRPKKKTIGKPTKNEFDVLQASKNRKRQADTTHLDEPQSAQKKRKVEPKPKKVIVTKASKSRPSFFLPKHFLTPSLIASVKKPKTKGKENDPTQIPDRTPVDNNIFGVEMSPINLGMNFSPLSGITDGGYLSTNWDKSKVTLAGTTTSFGNVTAATSTPMNCKSFAKKAMVNRLKSPRLPTMKNAAKKLNTKEQTEKLKEGLRQLAERNFNSDDSDSDLSAFFA